MTVDYRPSQVQLNRPLPLVGTLGRCEMEIAAALLVRACQLNGDRWQSLVPKMMGEALIADVLSGTEPFASLNSNPFARPDFHELVAKGYASGDLSQPAAQIELTDKAFEAMRRWVVAASEGDRPVADAAVRAAIAKDPT